MKLNYIPIDEADIEATSARTMQTAIAQNPDAIVVGDFVTSVVDPSTFRSPPDRIAKNAPMPVTASAPTTITGVIERFGLFDSGIATPEPYDALAASS